MGLFKSKRQREIESENRVRESKIRIERFISHSRKVERRYYELGKQALRLGDREQFVQLAGAVIQARQQANQWERYLLQLETLSVRREEVAATGAFIQGVSAVTTSILRGATPDQIAAMQLKMERALNKADALKQLLAVAMEGSAGAVFASEDLDERRLDELAGQMGGEAASEERADYDARIAQGLKQIEEQMRKEL